MPAEAALDGETIIYVIDDDEAVCDSLRVLLGLRGFVVDAYGSAEAFLGTVAGRGLAQRGCILLDLDLPGMSGIELLDRLHRNGSQLPVVVITGRSAASLGQVHARGAVAILEKPFLDGPLMSCIDRALGAAASTAT